MQRSYLDDQQRFVIDNFASAPPFASFLPGIAGPLGVPMWVFTTNRGQAIAGFGIENRDNPIMEFQPANKAYQTTPLTGFRTFIKIRGETPVLHEPFAPWETDTRSRMVIGMNTLELQTTCAYDGLQTTVTYFTLSDEPFAGLARQMQVTNVSDAPLALEILDGLPWMQPYGVDEEGLKMMGRTLEAWKGVFNVTPTDAGLSGVPFYRFQASAGDTAEVAEIQAGHFYLAFGEDDALLPSLVDPDVVFGPDTSLHTPQGFLNQPLAALQAHRQITTSKTPCGFFGMARSLAPGESLTLHAIIGHVGDLTQLQRHQARIARTDYLEAQQERATELAREITAVIETQTAEPRFDAYCRQTFLDNVVRGGWPLLLGDDEHPHVYHVYSRKHGDMERDYNAFHLAAERYSQGNGNYRDVAQNRRSDIFFEPQVDNFNVLSFLSLIQADGYNPLVVLGQHFTLAEKHHADALALVERPEPLAEALARPFTPGGLLHIVSDRALGLKVDPADFVTTALAHADAHFEAEFGEGYWIDHWFYNLDLIDSTLALYPDRKRTLLFEKRVPYFQSPASVQPRDRQYVLTPRGVRRYHALQEDEHKDEKSLDHWLRTTAGEVYRPTVFEKLYALALLKFATIDPWGMGVEMEAGRPGWYDALNGLPGLIGSSLCESYELLRLLDFLLATVTETAMLTVELPGEQFDLLETVRNALTAWEASPNEKQRDFAYWDAVATARERYRAQIRQGFTGETVTLDADTLESALRAFRAKVQVGLDRAVALNEGTPPTYFAYDVTEYETLDEIDDAGRPYVRPLAFMPHILPLFLEGPVHALKVAPDADHAREIHARVRESALYDRKLGMYKVNAPLAGESHELGRCRAFTPGWLENESIWLHMEYKYLLEMLEAGLYDDFFADFKQALVPFLNPATYGRSPLENSSFIVSSAHPDESLHGHGFVARLSGSTAEFLSIWRIMMVGQRPFQIHDGQLRLVLQPTLPGWLFRDDGTLAFNFLGNCTVTYHNPARKDTFDPNMKINRVVLESDEKRITFQGPHIEAPYAEMVRNGKIASIHVFFGSTKGDST